MNSYDLNLNVYANVTKTTT